MPQISEDTISDMFKVAKSAHDNAHAPYSAFKVGAAVRTPDGAVYAGCNVENVAYPEGTCAEAGAIATMVASGGGTTIDAVLVVADRREPVTPCGGCRQKLAEFGAGDLAIYLANMDGVQAHVTLAEILPDAFSQKHMDT